MNRKDCLAAFLIVPLGIAEIAEGGTHRFLVLHHTEIEAASSEGLASNPHTHFEIADGSVPTTVAPMFASGGQYEKESFRLHVVPAGSGFRLVGYPFGLSPDEGRPQFMFGYSPTVADLTGRLASGLNLPTAQVESIRRAALEGVTQEIGGYSPSAIRLFSRAVLESLGMNFRPPDS